MESTEESLSLCFDAQLESNESFSYSNYDKILNKGFLAINPGYIDNIDSHSNIFNIDWDKANYSNFIENFPIYHLKNFVTNEREENTSNSQQNNLIIEIENRNNNSAKIETPLISQENISKNKSNEGKKLLGRKKNGEKVNEAEGSSHDMYSNDNISVKIQTHFLNFIIQSLNCIFSHCNYDKQLSKLDYEFKKNATKENVEYLKNETIGNIISNNKISKKYTSINDKSEANKIICEEIKDISVLSKILSENYLVFFKKFYYNSDSYINLKDYGLDKDITFTKDAKNFKHFLKENEKRGSQYIKSIKRHVLKKYLPGSIFIS
jgi:hypothetical protein